MCREWFQNKSGGGNIGRIKDYSEAHVANYFLVLLSIVLFGVVMNLLPGTRTWIAKVEARAAKASFAASTPKGTPKSKRSKSDDVKKETDPLLKAQKEAGRRRSLEKHLKYLEEGEQAQIYRMNTMKAEFSKKAAK